MKRCLELLVVVIALVFIAPLLAIIAVAVKICDGGPVLFNQTRVGQFGRLFQMHKFRTMVTGAEQIGPQLTVDGDPRITPLGRWLRKTKLDELPQLFNVLKGEMALVGPRPEVPRYVALYTPQQCQVLLLRPGITDPASLEYFDESQRLAKSDDAEALYREVVMPAKIRLNLAYAGRFGMLGDLRIIALTVARMMGINLSAGRFGTACHLNRHMSKRNDAPSGA